MKFKRTDIMEIMFEIKKAKLLLGREDENTGNCVRCYADEANLDYIVVSSKGLMHEIGRTSEQEIAHMAFCLKEVEVFG